MVNDVNDYSCWIFREARSPQQAELPYLDKPASAVLNIQGALPAATPRLLTLRRVCHYYRAGLPAQRLIKLQFQDRLCIRIRRGHPLIMSGFS